MPKATVREGSTYRLPTDTLFTGRLTSVADKKVEFTYKAHHAAVKNKKKQVGEKGEVHKWVWTFTILNDGEFYGFDVELETEPAITTLDGDKVREIAETLLGRPVDLGEDFDTDLIVSLPCQFTIAHQEPRTRSDGKGEFYGCEIADVFPAPDDTPKF